MSDWHACAALVERGDPERFRASMAAPPEAREVLFAIYAANVEITRAPWVTAEPMIAEMRLQWWRDVLEEIEQEGAVRHHEVATPLARVLTKEGAQAMDRLIAARRWDIYKDPFEDAAHFTSYLEDTAGGLLFAACDALGQSQPQVATDAGYAAGLAAFLRAIPELVAQNRIPLLDGRPDAVAALANGGLARLALARKSKGKLARAACISLWQVAPILKQAAKDPEAVIDGRLAVAPLRSNLRLAQAAMRGRW